MHCTCPILKVVNTHVVLVNMPPAGDPIPIQNLESDFVFVLLCASILASLRERNILDARRLDVLGVVKESTQDSLRLQIKIVIATTKLAEWLLYTYPSGLYSRLTGRLRNERLWIDIKLVQANKDLLVLHQYIQYIYS